MDGWDGPPVVMMTYNPRYYVDYIENAGTSTAQNLFAFLSDVRSVKPDGTGLNPKLLRVAEHARQRSDVTIRPIDMANFQTRCRLLQRSLQPGLVQKLGFVPLTDAELDHEISALKPIIDPDTIFFVFKGERPVAAGLPFRT